MKTQMIKFFGVMSFMVVVAFTAIANDLNKDENFGSAADGKGEIEKVTGAYTVKIFNNVGSIVFEESAETVIGSDTQGLGSLPDGYYTYQVVHGKELVYRAIIAKNSNGELSVNDLPGNASASVSQQDDLVLVRLFKDDSSRARIVITDEGNQVVYSRRTKKSAYQCITHDIANLPEGKYNLNVYNKGVMVAQKQIVK